MAPLASPLTPPPCVKGHPSASRRPRRSVLVKSALGAAVAAVSLASPATAALVNAPLPTNAFIHFGGLDWAWASPLPADGGGFGAGYQIDLSFQAPLGWRLPTLAELAAAPDAVDFLFAGANTLN